MVQPVACGGWHVIEASRVFKEQGHSIEDGYVEKLCYLLRMDANC